MLEILETASDAWSTDVLASDTSERQADRLLELEQVTVFGVPRLFYSMFCYGCMLVFVVLEIGWEEHFTNDLICVRWYVKP